mmetsp:Transcript_26722/g.64112  ORF Transcript_26722/g.64112 Transcript_26722/m.64112 type:complete len:256 (-) Transcript_26722:1587-2354(-)
MRPEPQSARTFRSVLARTLSFVAIAVAAYFTRPIDARHHIAGEDVDNIRQRVLVGEGSRVVVDVDMIESGEEVEFQPFLQSTFSIVHVSPIPSRPEARRRPCAGDDLVDFGRKLGSECGVLLIAFVLRYGARSHVHALGHDSVSHQARHANGDVLPSAALVYFGQHVILAPFDVWDEGIIQLHFEAVLRLKEFPRRRISRRRANRDDINVQCGIVIDDRVSVSHPLVECRGNGTVEEELRLPYHVIVESFRGGAL